jgi:serine phosphatase RsbU (regulator of sigma subunit)/PAS domain-containing protein
MVALIFFHLFLFTMIFFIVVFLRNRNLVEMELDKIFRDFLIMEKTLSNFSQHFFQYLTGEVRLAFSSNGIIFFRIGRESIRLEAFSKKNHFRFPETFLPLKDETEISFSEVKWVPGGSELPEMLAKRLLGNHGYRVFYSVQLEGETFAVFVLYYGNFLTCLNGRFQLLANRRRLSEILRNIVAVLQEKQHNLSAITMENLRDYAVVTTDNWFNVASWNRGAEIMFGYSFKEVMYTNFRQFILTDEMDNFEKGVEISSRKEETIFKLEMKDYNQTPLMTEILLRKISIGGVTAGYYILIKNITKEEIWKNNIRNQSLINKSIVENTRDAILMLNEEDRIIFFNEKLRAVTDSSLNYLGVDVSRIFPIQYVRNIQEKIQELRSGQIEMVYLNLKMGELWYNIRFFPMRSPDGVYQGAILFLIDHTIIMETNDKLDRLSRNLLKNMEMAKILQMSLVPQLLPENENISFRSLFIPSFEIGGDFYYVDELQTEEGKQYLLLIADVSGHGIDAAMLTVLVKDTYNDFKILLETGRVFQVSQFLRMLNQKLINLNLEGNKFITSFVMQIDLRRMQIRYSSAGHPHAYIISGEGDISTFGIRNSPPVGMFEKMVYHDEHRTVAEGDRVCLYSDGVADLFEEQGLSFQDYLKQTVKRENYEVYSSIEEKLSELQSEKFFHTDDITLLIASVKAREKFHETRP